MLLLEVLVDVVDVAALIIMRKSIVELLQCPQGSKRKPASPSAKVIKLLSKIDKAIKKISDNTYGYCEETGEPIGLKRLIARPIATLSIESQERHEKNEKIFAN